MNYSEDIRHQYIVKRQEILRKYESMNSVDKYLSGFGNYGQSCKTELDELRAWKKGKDEGIEEAERWMDGVIGGHSVVVEEKNSINWFIASWVVFMVSCGLLFIFSRLGGFE